MKKLIATLVLSLSLSLTAFAGEIPGSNPCPQGGCRKISKTSTTLPIIDVVETLIALAY